MSRFARVDTCGSLLPPRLLLNDITIIHQRLQDDNYSPYLVSVKNYGTDPQAHLCQNGALLRPPETISLILQTAKMHLSHCDLVSKAAIVRRKLIFDLSNLPKNNGCNLCNKVGVSLLNQIL